MKLTRIPLLLGLVLATSCGGDGKGNGNGIPVAEACPQATSVFCDKVFACDELLAIRTIVGTREGCMNLGQSQVCPTGSLCAAGETYSPTAAQECKNALAAQSCAAFAAGVTSGDPLGAEPACSAVCSGP
jgi:hypothetical protein